MRGCLSEGCRVRVCVCGEMFEGKKVRRKAAEVSGDGERERGGEVVSVSVMEQCVRRRKRRRTR